MEYIVEILIGLVITIGGGLILYYVFGVGKTNKPTHDGGKGGNAKVTGSNSVAIGGIGGGGGSGGKGGDGGSAEVAGDNAFAMGGEGGEAGQLDRGGRGGRSPLEILGVPNMQLPDGAGPVKNEEN
jgi:hypothetical protein